MKLITVFLFIVSFGVGSAQNFRERTNFPTDGSSFYIVHSLITNLDFASAMLVTLKVFNVLEKK